MSHEPDRHSPATSSLPVVPTCQSCGKQMRVVSAEPSPRFVNVDRWSYRCDCGETWHAFIAKED